MKGQGLEFSLDHERLNRRQTDKQKKCAWITMEIGILLMPNGQGR